MIESDIEQAKFSPEDLETQSANTINRALAILREKLGFVDGDAILIKDGYKYRVRYGIHSIGQHFHRNVQLARHQVRATDQRTYYGEPGTELAIYREHNIDSLSNDEFWPEFLRVSNGTDDDLHTQPTFRTDHVGYHNESTAQIAHFENNQAAVEEINKFLDSI